jgi:cytoskeleton protein RodZ
LPSFGEKLRQEREKRNITLEQISATTKIGTRMLQALEEDKFNQLPGGIFNKGFVRAYSRCVGLDEDQTVADYLQASGDAVRTEAGARENEGQRVPEKIAAKDHEELRERDSRSLVRLEGSAETPSRQLPWGLFAALLLLIALALSLWNRREREHEKQSLHPVSNAKATQVAASQSSGDVTSQKPGEMAPDRSGEASSPLISESGRPVSSAAPKGSQSLQAGATPAPGEFTVVIQAREDSWISIVADGKAVSSELLTAGTERTVRGRQAVTVKAGNAGGVDFQFNGKKVDIAAEYGEVKTVTFGPGGMLRNAPVTPTQP